MRNLSFFICLLMIACTNDVKDIDAIFQEVNGDKEIAIDVEILYSDSSYVRIKIEAPKMIRHLNKLDKYEEFPDGLKVSFYNDYGKETSWLEAGYAIRREDEKQVFVKEDVLVYNTNNDKMRTIELIWDERKKLISTEKAVKIMQPSLGDTLFGFGVIANQDFTKFEIKRSVSAKKRFESLFDE